MVNMMEFEWNEDKNTENQRKHKVTFQSAQRAFFDEQRIIAEDTDHSQEEGRYFCIGKIKEGIVTIRFTHRNNKIRIIGAGFWRKGKKEYEEKN